MVFTQYDVWSDFPDRPWNLVAGANGVIGLITRPELHTPTAFAAPSDAVLLSGMTNEKGCTTKIYMTPTAELALTDPLRLLGAPDLLTDALDSGLRPMVDAGYSRNDVGPVRLRYVARGQIVGSSAVGSVAPRRLSAGSQSHAGTSQTTGDSTDSNRNGARHQRETAERPRDSNYRLRRLARRNQMNTNADDPELSVYPRSLSMPASTSLSVLGVSPQYRNAFITWS